MKTSVKILIVVVVILVGLRIYLPYWVTDYVNQVLDDIPGYTGSVEDVDIHLYRGAYRIQKLKIVKEGEDIPVPFVDAVAVDFSVQWDALFDGRVVGEVELIRPVINFVVAVSDSTAAEQAGGEADWTEPIKELLPLKINRLTATNGKITYRDYAADPQVNISLDSIELQATNIDNAEHHDKALPSNIHATATSIGGGRLVLNAEANLLKEIPDFDMNASFEGVALPALNDFTNAYAKLDFEKGGFNLYSEMAVSKGILTGYMKPVLTDLKVVDFSEDKKNPLKLVWESISGLILELFENHSKDQFATKVPMNGNLNDVKTSIWPTIGNIFKNAFIKAFTKKTDDTVSFGDLKQKGKSDDDD